MIGWLRNLQRKMATTQCASCGEAVLVSEYRKTGRTRKETWWAGPVEELQCPKCGHTFWVRE
jgi:predicted RNA-binding Zn-ribbon protein involved in translation (DUF1610 family)